MKPQNKVSKVMREFKSGELHSGKSGKVVKNPKQAIAIALSEAGMSKPKKFKEGGEMKKDSKAMAKKEIAFMQKKGAPKSMVKHEKKEYGLKKGGKAYAGGGLTDFYNQIKNLVPQGSNKVARPPLSTTPTMGTIKKASSSPAKTPSAIGTRTTMMKKGGLTAGHKSADGIAKKGRTSAKMVKMMRGGKAC